MATTPVSAATISLGVALLLAGSAAQSFAYVHRGATVHRAGVVHHRGVYHRGTTVVGPNGGVYHHGATAVGRYGGVYHRGATAIGPNGRVYHRGGTIVRGAPAAIVAPAAAGAVVAPAAAGAVVAPPAAGAVVTPAAGGAAAAAPAAGTTPAGSQAIPAPAFAQETSASATTAAATKPTEAQIDAIRQACRADYGVHCAAAPTGGQAALACLQQHASSLSAGCQQAIGAISSAPAVTVTPPAAVAPATPAPAAVAAPAAATPTSATPAPAAPPAVAAPAVGASPEQRPRATLQELLVLRRACGPDFRAYCGGLRPGDGRIVDCLRANRASLSSRCKNALTSL